MAPDWDRLVRRATFCLLALGSGATEIAAVETRLYSPGLPSA
jgi:hypothetical protein